MGNAALGIERDAAFVLLDGRQKGQAPAGKSKFARQISTGNGSFLKAVTPS